VLKTPRIRLQAGGAVVDVDARAVTEPAEVEQVVAAFRAKYSDRDVESYYPKHDAAVEVALE
jgi:hypothetical protein